MSVPPKKPMVPEPAPLGRHMYTTEISQMMFVFGEIQDPDSSTVNLVEELVRTQIIELIAQARVLASRRGARYSNAEDLIFLIRHDRPKVNRLRTYLSWKDVRKHAKDSGGDVGAGDVDGLPDAEGVEGGGDDKLAAGKAQKITIKLPWEITTLYSDILKASGHQDEEEEDEDDIEAQEASIARLKEADDATKEMTREQYQHYSDCRQASFTYRKAKRFREFLNLPPHLDLKANDDTFDIVGFLAFEMVRSLTIAGLAVKKSQEDAAEYTSSTNKRKATTDGLSPSSKRQRQDASPDRTGPDESSLPVSSLFLGPPEARGSLQPEHIQDAYSRMQSRWNQHSQAGMRKWRGGLVRSRVNLI